MEEYRLTPDYVLGSIQSQICVRPEASFNKKFSFGEFVNIGILML